MTYLILLVSVIVISIIFTVGNLKIIKLREKLFYERVENYKLHQKLKNINLQ